MELVTSSGVDDGILMTYAELASRVVRSDAPPTVRSVLGLAPKELTEAFVSLGELTWSARVESLSVADADYFRGVGDAVSQGLATADSAYRINIVDDDAPRKLLWTRGADGACVTMSFEDYDWFVVQVSTVDVIPVVVSRALEASRGFVVEEFGSAGVVAGLAWDGKSTSASYSDNQWGTKPATATDVGRELVTLLAGS